MTAGSPARAAGSQPRRELALLLLLGAAGAGLAVLATRQGWARVETAAPRPLPASVTTVTGQALVPAEQEQQRELAARLAAGRTRGTARGHLRSFRRLADADRFALVAASIGRPRPRPRDGLRRG